MTGTEADLPGGPSTPPGLPVVAAALRAVGYDVDAVRGLLLAGGELSGRPADLVVYERRLAVTPGPLADVVGLLAIGQPVATDRLVVALGRPAVDTLIAAAAVAEDGAVVVPRLRLVPHGDVLIASDRRPAPDDPVDPLHVTGINAPAGLLASLTVRRRVERALDLGTGNGIQAVLAARHCDHVVATDVNPRALRYAAFNAALNEAGAVEPRLGSLFEPVAGETFGLVVSNPPYVISPDADYAYRDSGREPAALCREVVGRLPEHLEPGGYATVLVSWPDGASSPADWLASDVDAWLLHWQAEDALTHAAKWNRPIAESDVPAYAAAVDRWAGYYRGRGIERICFGAVIQRRRTGAGPRRGRLLRVDELRTGHGSAGPQIERVFAAADRAVDGSAPMLRPVAGARIDQTSGWVDGQWRLGSATLRLDEGLGIEVGLDGGVLVQVLGALDGTRTVAEAALVAAELTGVPASDLDDLTATAARMAGELYGLGILEPVPPAS